MVNVLLDSGSDRSYATSTLIKKVKPIRLGQVNVAFNSFGNEHTSKQKIRSIFTLDLVTEHNLL